MNYLKKAQTWALNATDWVASTWLGLSVNWKTVSVLAVALVLLVGMVHAVSASPAPKKVTLYSATGPSLGCTTSQEGADGLWSCSDGSKSGWCFMTEKGNEGGRWVCDLSRESAEAKLRDHR